MKGTLSSTVISTAICILNNEVTFDLSFFSSLLNYQALISGHNKHFFFFRPLNAKGWDSLKHIHLYSSLPRYHYFKEHDSGYLKRRPQF